MDRRPQLNLPANGGHADAGRYSPTFEEALDGKEDFHAAIAKGMLQRFGVRPPIAFERSKYRTTKCRSRPHDCKDSSPTSRDETTSAKHNKKGSDAIRAA
jgi:hypothetical protein